MKQLTTTKQVFDALGGIPGVCELTGANRRQAWNWYSFFGAFPPNTYVVLMQALARKGFSAPPRLWKMKGLKRERSKAA
jgi:hypothetical protein